LELSNLNVLGAMNILATLMHLTWANSQSSNSCKTWPYFRFSLPSRKSCKDVSILVRIPRYSNTDRTSLTMDIGRNLWAIGIMGKKLGQRVRGQWLRTSASPNPCYLAELSSSLSLSPPTIPPTRLHFGLLKYRM
jgi:hypothetical protein